MLGRRDMTSQHIDHQQEFNDLSSLRNIQNDNNYEYCDC